MENRRNTYNKNIHIRHTQKKKIQTDINIHNRQFMKHMLTFTILIENKKKRYKMYVDIRS